MSWLISKVVSKFSAVFQSVRGSDTESDFDDEIDTPDPQEWDEMFESSGESASEDEAEALPKLLVSEKTEQPELEKEHKVYEGVSVQSDGSPGSGIAKHSIDLQEELKSDTIEVHQMPDDVHTDDLKDVESAQESEEKFDDTESDIGSEYSDGLGHTSISEGVYMFHLISVTLDNQNNEYVSKALTMRKGIHQLCNWLSPSSSTALGSRINFSTLNALSGTIIGVFGTKKEVTMTISQLLNDAGLSFVTLEKSLQNCDVGLYMICAAGSEDTADDENSEIMILFFWPNEGAFTEVGRRNIACTFLRYLKDACDVVICCPTAEEIEKLPDPAVEISTNPISSNRKKKRKKKRQNVRSEVIQLELKQEKENNVFIVKGFDLHVADINAAPSANDLDTLEIFQPNFTSGNKRQACFVPKLDKREIQIKQWFFKGDTAKEVKQFIEEKRQQMDVVLDKKIEFYSFAHVLECLYPDSVEDLVNLDRELEKDKNMTLRELEEKLKFDTRLGEEPFRKEFLTKVKVLKKQDMEHLKMAIFATKHRSNVADKELMEQDIDALLEFYKTSENATIAEPKKRCYLRGKTLQSLADLKQLLEKFVIGVITHNDDENTLNSVKDARIKSVVQNTASSSSLETKFKYSQGIFKAFKHLVISRDFIADKKNIYDNLLKYFLMFPKSAEFIAVKGGTILERSEEYYLKDYNNTPKESTRRKKESSKINSYFDEQKKKERKTFQNSIESRFFQRTGKQLALTIIGVSNEKRGGWNLVYKYGVYSKPTVSVEFSTMALLQCDAAAIAEDSSIIRSPQCLRSRELDTRVESTNILRMTHLLNNGNMLLVWYNRDSACTDILISSNHKYIPLMKLKRPVELVAFDEDERCFAAYSKKEGRIQFSKFDLSFSVIRPQSIEIDLNRYGITASQIFFLETRSHFCIVTSENLVKTFDLKTATFLRGREFTLHSGSTRCISSLEGAFMFGLTAVGERDRSESKDIASDEEVQRNAGEFAIPAEKVAQDVSIHLSSRVSESKDIASEEDVHGDADESVIPAEKVAHIVSMPLPPLAKPEDLGADLDPDPEARVQLRVFVLAKKGEIMKDVVLPTEIKAKMIPSLHLSTFGGQTHLLGMDIDSKNIVSCKVDVVLSEEQLHFTKSVHSGVEEEVNAQVGFSKTNKLDYFHHIFEKFPILSTLEEYEAEEDDCSDDDENDTPVTVPFQTIFVVDSDNIPDSTRRRCKHFPKRIIYQIHNQLHKDAHHLQWKSSVMSLNSLSSTRVLKDTLFRGQVMGKFIERLITLVSIQIARAADNRFRLMYDGKEDPVIYLQCGDTPYAIQNAISLGCYEALFREWKGQVKVITSMGRQSVGKSFMLNHISGSLFDVSGGRCTDGVWMTFRAVKDCLYVVMDFEGLGSFERSDQEDTLLSVFNAALSNLTLFKLEYRFGSDTAAMFKRFQDGVSLIKGDDRLFSGLLCLVIKDVVSQDVSDLKAEFQKRIKGICAASRKDNFLLKMYRGRYAIHAFPPLGDPEFFSNLHDLVGYIDDTSGFDNGFQFLSTMKLLMAKLYLNDWSNLAGQVVSMRVELLRDLFPIVLGRGCLTKSSRIENGEMLSCLDDNSLIVPVTADEIYKCMKDLDSEDKEQEVLDPGGQNIWDVQWPNVVDILESGNMVDAGFELPCDTEDSFGFTADKDASSFFEKIFAIAKEILPRNHQNFPHFTTFLSSFLAFLSIRRKLSAMKWVDINTKAFSQDSEVKGFRKECQKQLDRMCQELTICAQSCKKCYYKCTLKKYHKRDHNCLGSHECEEGCTYCLEEAKGATDDVRLSVESKVPDMDQLNADVALSEEPQTFDTVKCGDKAGHNGRHDCRKIEHSCKSECHLSHLDNCNKTCALVSNHDSELDCLCNTDLHLCGHPCSLDTCENRCVIPYSRGKEHERHECSANRCPMKCPVVTLDPAGKPDVCGLQCSSKNHFHELGLSQHHYCGHEHRCPEQCDRNGICEIKAHRQMKKRTFHGERGTFDYDIYTEMNAEKRPCGILIPANKTSHDGSHICTDDPNRVHYCDQRCPTCEYFCELDYAHEEDLHHTTHGNVRGHIFVSEQKNIDVGARKYVSGERGDAEMCHLFCKHRGQGHIHLVECEPSEAKESRDCEQQGQRHETQKYGPNFDVSKDELTHAAHWRKIGFKDPCTEEEQKHFGTCDHRCPHPNHDDETEGAEDSEKGPSFCIEPLWHEAVGRDVDEPGFSVSGDGHKFQCQHDMGKLHVIFVIDRSGSMGSSDQQPSLTKIVNSPGLNNRLGCVYNAIDTFVMNRKHKACNDILSTVLFESSAKMIFTSKSLHDDILGLLLQHGTCGGTDFTSGLLEAGKLIPNVDDTKPVFIFLSDGGDWNPNEARKTLKWIIAKYPELKVYTIKFGNNTDNQALTDMARIGNGEFHQSIDSLDLEDYFSHIANSLSNPKAALMKEFTV